MGLHATDGFGLDTEPRPPASRRNDLDGALANLLGPDALFRSGQREAIEAVLDDGARVLLVQKTGWGKSIVYWLATRMRRDQGKGPTLIISPLLALMRDQIRAASAIGLRAATVNSQNRDGWAGIREGLERDEIDVLLISPERLANDDFIRSFLPSIQGSLGLFVVDEVHCVSDWGHDFRPDYRRISTIIGSLPESVPILGTTATANSRVRADVAEQLGPAAQTVVGPLARDSLRLATLTVADQAERLAWLARYVPHMPGSGIIYCLTVGDVERVAAWLVRHGVEARAYHGRQSSEEREALEVALQRNELDVLVATVALGMGFDKPDLSYVIHFQRPGSVIAYYQQVGRAGRAVRSADGILLSGQEDDEIQEFFIRSAFPPIDDLRAVLDAVASTDTTTIGYLETVVNLPRNRISAILRILEVDGAIARHGSRFFRTATTWVPDEDRAERVTALRHEELDEMREYLSTSSCLMRFLVSALDDDQASDCGRCMNCRQQMPLSTVDSAVVREAVSFLKRDQRFIKPRLKWARGAVPSLNGFIDEPCEPGLSLAMYGDAGWGTLIKRAKYEKYAFDEELLDAAADVIKARWTPDPDSGWWVASIPSRGGSTLVSDAARAIADRLGLEYRAGVLTMQDTGYFQKEMQNSVQQLRNAYESLVLEPEQVTSSPVLLVDDMVDSRWTLTVAGHLLRLHGSRAVYPFAFAEATSRIDR